MRFLSIACLTVLSLPALAQQRYRAIVLNTSSPTAGSALGSWGRIGGSVFVPGQPERGFTWDYEYGFRTLATLTGSNVDRVTGVSGDSVVGISAYGTQAKAARWLHGSWV